MAKKDLVPVSTVAETLGVRPQTVYNWIRKGLLKATKVGRSKCIDPAEAKRVHEAEANKPKGQGGKRSNWTALTEKLKASKKDQVVLSVNRIREIIESPNAKLENLHYWDPYRAAQARGQGPGLLAVRAAGFELEAITFAPAENINMLGVATITFRRAD